MLTEVGLIIMPDTIADLTWVFFSTFTLLLLMSLTTILWYFGRRIIKKMDEMTDALIGIQIVSAREEQRLTDHIGSVEVHCKGPLCKKVPA